MEKKREGKKKSDFQKQIQKNDGYQKILSLEHSSKWSHSLKICLGIPHRETRIPRRCSSSILSRAVDAQRQRCRRRGHHWLRQDTRVSDSRGRGAPRQARPGSVQRIPPQRPRLLPLPNARTRPTSAFDCSIDDSIH